MPFIHLLVLSFIQGVTEFLPISSQAHLIAIPYLLGWTPHGRIVDVAVHFGTLLSVIIYFHKRLLALLTEGFFPLFRGRFTRQTSLIIYLCVATVPCVILGYLLDKFIPDWGRNIELICATSIVFGLLLYGVDRYASQNLTLSKMTVPRALFIGCAQVLAFLPGASRSGTTITAGRWLGFSRVDSTEFSFLMSIPVISAALILNICSIQKQAHLATLLTWGLFWGTWVSFITGLLAIHFLLQWLKHRSYAPLMVYRVCFGFLLFIWSLYLA